MRQIIELKENWLFQKNNIIPLQLPQDWEAVTLPHTWNAADGQDGGGDYYRGHGVYVRSVKKKELPERAKYYLEVNGANSSAVVYWNGEKIAEHDGGYSTWRVELKNLQEENLLVIDVDNLPNDHVYPQLADFTFYGGLYRMVRLIAVSESHFDLETYGTTGIHVTPNAENKSAEIEVTLCHAKAGQELFYCIKDAEHRAVVTARTSAEQCKVTLDLEQVHLWHGRKDPYLYTVEVQLMEQDMILDSVQTRIGFRSFRMDPERGFILNGEEYPLRGVSRHQDRWGVGNALLPEHHKEDMELIHELGATTIRLAHYQQDQYVYDLCDEMGFVVWAEIPYISRHLENGVENTIQQMKELITQNYNHPSIVCWGLSNEITMIGSAGEDIKENHRILNDLCHAMDKTRVTTMACFTTAPIDDPYLSIPDILSYNHYFGWYGGSTEMNGPWFDKFHKANPNMVIGCSEYGCEALNWHSSQPQQGDYTEEYQAHYHEELIRQLYSRKYIWATHVWNMFDFGCDERNEGGEAGQNHKGLVTIDRQYKKDAFYAYKAWLSDEPFVHICGKRYIDRVEDVTKVTVYSNQPEVELFANGVSLGKKKAEDHFFYFDVPNVGETTLKAVAGACVDHSSIRKVTEFNETYRFKEQGAILNWFEITAPQGYLSVNDKLSDIAATFRGKLCLLSFGLKLFKVVKASPKLSSGKKNSKKKKGGNPLGMLKNISGLMEMAGGFTAIRMCNMVGLASVKIDKETVLDLNRKLNKIKKK